MVCRSPGSPRDSSPGPSGARRPVPGRGRQGVPGWPQPRQVLAVSDVGRAGSARAPPRKAKRGRARSSRRAVAFRDDAQDRRRSGGPVDARRLVVEVTVPVCPALRVGETAARGGVTPAAGICLDACALGSRGRRRGPRARKAGARLLVTPRTGRMAGGGAAIGDRASRDVLEVVVLQPAQRFPVELDLLGARDRLPVLVHPWPPGQGSAIQAQKSRTAYEDARGAPGCRGGERPDARDRRSGSGRRQRAVGMRILAASSSVVRSGHRTRTGRARSSRSTPPGPPGPSATPRPAPSSAGTPTPSGWPRSTGRPWPTSRRPYRSPGLTVRHTARARSRLKSSSTPAAPAGPASASFRYNKMTSCGREVFICNGCSRPFRPAGLAWAFCSFVVWGVLRARAASGE